jgi:hypothetical protein
MLCIALSSTDISDQVPSKLAQSESEGRLRALMMASTDGVYRMNPDWTQMRQLDGRGFLKNTSDPHAFSLDDYIPPEDQKLVLVKNLVELHCGTVSCASQGLGKGSTFTVRLPRLHDQSSLAAPQRAEAATEQTTTPLRIMVVDDNVDAASMTAMLLEASGHEVLVEHEAHRALERARGRSARLPARCRVTRNGWAGIGPSGWVPILKPPDRY